MGAVCGREGGQGLDVYSRGREKGVFFPECDPGREESIHLRADVHCYTLCTATCDMDKGTSCILLTNCSSCCTLSPSLLLTTARICLNLQIAKHLPVVALVDCALCSFGL